MNMQADGKVGKWMTHYCSDHKILLVGEGDFSFSLSLARSFGSASNIVASSLDSYDDVTKKYKHAKSNLEDLKNLGACLLHGVDATKMSLHSYLESRRFDRIIFNFPHAGFHGKEDDSTMIQSNGPERRKVTDFAIAKSENPIPKYSWFCCAVFWPKMHKNLVLGFFENASCLLQLNGELNGEIHVNHKTNAPFSNWNIEELAKQSSLELFACADFRKEDYPGYNNKRGDSNRCDEPFPLGECSTFKFKYNPSASGKRKMIDYMTNRQQRNLPFQEAVENLPTSAVDFSYYPQTNHVSRLNEALSSTFGLTNGYTPTFGSYLNNAALVHERVAPCARYFAHGMSLGSWRSLQPSQPMQSFGARNDGHQVLGGDSNYLQEARGRTAENAGYSFERERSNFERNISKVPRRTLSGARNEGYGALGGSLNYLQEAPGRTAENFENLFDRGRSDFERYILEAPRRILSGARNERYHSHGGSSNYLQEARGRADDNAGYSFDIERYIAEIPRTLSGARNEGYRALGGSSNYLQEAPGRMVEIAGYSFDRVRTDL